MKLAAWTVLLVLLVVGAHARNVENSSTPVALLDGQTKVTPKPVGHDANETTREPVYTDEPTSEPKTSDSPSESFKVFHNNHPYLPSLGAKPSSEPQPAYHGFLDHLQWHQGNDDVSLENEKKVYLFSDPPMGHADYKRRQIRDTFGVDAVQEKAQTEDGKNEKTVSPGNFLSDMLGAQLVRAYTRAFDPGAYPTQELAEFEKVLKENPHMEEALREQFSELDLNHDGAIDNDELKYGEEVGLLSKIGVRTLKSWDVNYSRRVAWQEFRLGPLFIVILENHPEKLVAFRRGYRSGMNDATNLFRKHLGSYYMNNPAALGMLQLEETNYQVPEYLPEGSLMEMGEERKRWGFFKRLAKKVKRFFKKRKAKRKAKKAKRKAKKEEGVKRAKSRFGVPAYDDETCVVCQYVVQRVQKALETSIVDDPVGSAFDNYPKPVEPTGGRGIELALNNLASAPKTGGSRDELVFERGHLSGIRMIKTQAEVVMREACGLKAPFLFRGHCKKVWRRRRKIAEALFYKQDAAESCTRARLCDKHSYFSAKYSVHYPMMSDKLNAMRGLCGMIGGTKKHPKNRKSYMMCLAKLKLQRSMHPSLVRSSKSFV